MTDDARRAIQYRAGVSDDFQAHSALGQAKAGGTGVGEIVVGAVVGTVMTPVEFAQNIGGRLDGSGSVSLDRLGTSGFNTLFLLATLRGSRLDPKLSTLGSKLATVSNLAEAGVAALRSRNLVQAAGNLRSQGLLRGARPGELGPNVLGGTDAFGGIVVASGQRGAGFAATLRHEMFHSVMSRVGGLPARVWYTRNAAWRFAEELGAELTGTGNLRHSLRFPGENGYLEGPSSWVDLPGFQRRLPGYGADGVSPFGGGSVLGVAP